MLRVYILVSSVWFVVSGENNVTKLGEDKQNIQTTPVAVDSRFFDLGQLFSSSPLFSNFNQNRPAGNAGANLPQNSQFLPSQGNLPHRPNPRNERGNQGDIWPFQNQEFNPTRPNGASQWQRPQFSNEGGLVRPNNPDVSNNYPIQRPNPGNNQNPSYWRPDNFQGSNQFGSNDPNTQTQLPTNQGQEWSQPRPVSYPDQNRPIMYPGQGFQSPPSTDDNNYYPDNNDQEMYPGNDSQQSNFKPNQGSWQNPSNPGSGTLDNISPQIYNGSGNNAILGKPVIIPTTTGNPDQIVFYNSSESPLQRQCVQDCPATPEYNPICGTNNVTYFNPGKFVCARNCGVSVYVARRGVCRPRPRRMI